MSAQETEDAELVALAALAFHESVIAYSEQQRFGQPQCDPNHPNGWAAELGKRMQDRCDKRYGNPKP